MIIQNQFAILLQKNSVTLQPTYHAEGAYSHTQRTVILTVVDVNQAILLQRFLKKNEPTAFITVTKSSEIIGKGFSNYI